MYFSRYVYSLPFWTFWVALGLGWAFAASLIIILLPIWESRQGLVDLVKGLIAGKPVVAEVTSAEMAVVDGKEGVEAIEELKV